MKNTLLLPIIVIFMMLMISCGTSRKAIEAQNIAIQQELEAMRGHLKPSRSVRSLDPCEVLALEDSPFFRAAGTAIAKNVTEARGAAATDARNQLAQMIRVVVSGASQDYNKSMATNSFSRSQSIGEEIMNQYVYQTVDFTKPIKWSIYDLSDGSVQVFVCIEMTKDPEELKIELRNRMQQNIYSPQAPFVISVNVNPAAEVLFNDGKELCVSHDHDLGIPKLMQAIEMGSLNAMYYVGLMYLYGDNVDKDSKLAFQYIQSASNRGHKEAIFQVAEMYNSGTGTSKDKVQARYWYRRAKELSDDRADGRLRRL